MLYIRVKMCVLNATRIIVSRITSVLILHLVVRKLILNMELAKNATKVIPCPATTA